MKINHLEIRGGYTLGLIDYFMGELSDVWMISDISGGFRVNWFMPGKELCKDTYNLA
jgi:hypothetical protein